MFGPAGFPPIIYLKGFIDPNKHSILAGKGQGKLFYFSCFLMSLSYMILYLFISIVNLLLLGKIIYRL